MGFQIVEYFIKAKHFYLHKLENIMPNSVAFTISFNICP